MEYVLIIFCVIIVVGALVALYALKMYLILGINIFLSAKDDPADSISKDNSDCDKDLNVRSSRSNSRISRSLSYASSVVDLIRSNGLYVTVKLTLSFLQVLMGTIPRLNIEWNSSVSNLVDFADLNPMTYFPILSGCTTKERLNGPFVHILLIALVPIGFLVVLGSVKWVMQQLLRRNAPRVLEGGNGVAVRKALFDVTLRALVWFCLVSFPLLTSG
jgi:hypothetical protein